MLIQSQRYLNLDFSVSPVPATLRLCLFTLSAGTVENANCTFAEE